MHRHVAGLLFAGVALISSGLAIAAEEGSGSELLRGVLDGARALAEPSRPATREESADLWDAFLTVVAKRAAQESDDEALRGAFFAALLEGRFDAVGLLGAAAGAKAEPLQQLFESGWPRLAPLIEQLVAKLPRESGGRWRGLLETGRALEQIGKSGGAVAGKAGALGLTPDRLRQLARIVLPPSAADPLLYDTAVDPDLREVFGFGAPLAVALASPDRSVAGWTPLDWLIPAAHAGHQSLDVAALRKRLTDWAPTRADADQYLPLVHELLHMLTDQTLEAKPLEPEYRELYEQLMLATAWQESCWRQFVRDAQGRVTPIQSGVGSVGLMQVNQRVWRGFYDVARLQRDIAYNGAAGAEILRYYLRDYAIAKGEPTETGSVENLARSTYSIYNGGPGHIRRYRNPKARADLVAIDAAFLEKFRAVQGGNELGVAGCYGR